MKRDLLAQEALKQIPKILTLLDRNPHSPTYGCFDRNLWHYRIIDFPSGMSQEFVWPLALAFDTQAPNNPFYGQLRLRDWVEAAILYAARSAHRDGSCDDYFPYERAAGAAAFSLLACMESYRLLGLKNQEALAFFSKRADWLSSCNESGNLSNHQALIVICLELAGRLLNTNRWDLDKTKRIERLLGWQSQEGWFPEYDGCDPGYHTLTISLLAQLQELTPTVPLRNALEKAVLLAAELIHPDGSYGGEYGSRNTYNYFPHGFELVGKWYPQALSVNDLFLEGIARGRGACYADDHIIGHHVWDYLLAWRDFVTPRPSPPVRPQKRVYLREAGILIDRRDNVELYVSLNKGGTFKLFRNGEFVSSDTQFSLQVKRGRKRKNAVGHLVDRYECQEEDQKIIVSGSLGWAKHTQMTTARLMLLRAVMVTVGRFFPNLIRRLLQAILITGKRQAPFTFRRSFSWVDSRWHVMDELNADSWASVEGAGIGCDQTSIYVVMSRTFQEGQMKPWLDLSEAVHILTPGQALKVERTL
jgi:hypothetical protein